MGAENVIITGNQAANNSQYSGGRGGGSPIKPKEIQYGRVTAINPDRSIQYELIRNNLKISKLIFNNAVVGTAYNFNPNFTRLPEVGEIVPLIEGPNNHIGDLSRQYDRVTYYIIGPIAIQNTVDDNKVPQDNPPLPTDSVANYRMNEMGFVRPQPGQVVPSTTPTPTPDPTPTPSLTPTPTPTPTPTLDPRGTFKENYTNRAGQEFELYWRRSGFGIETSAYRRGTNNAVASNKLNADASNQQQIINLTANAVKLTLQDNVYP
jgi:hypothetical protein